MRAKMILLAVFLLAIVLASGFSLYYLGPKKAVSKPVSSSLLYSTNPTDKYSELAKTMLEGLDAGDHQKTRALYDDEMLKVLLPEKESALWTALTSQYGRFRKITGYSRTDEPPYYFVLVKSDFEKAAIIFRIIFNEKKQIVGFFVQEVI